MKTALIVAFHFPPYGAGSGILRILKFCRYLPESDWQPVLLTASTRAYERTDPTLLKEVPPSLPVVRAFALDTQRHLSLRGRYSRLMALPDRWSSWLPAAVVKGAYLVRKKQVDVIVTTYPIATAVLIGFILHKLTSKPWVVDFRDSMTEDDYPRDALTRRVSRWVEKKAIQHASRLIFTARSTIEMYRKRYPSLSAEKCLLIPNGYDEEDFQLLPAPAKQQPGSKRCLQLLHLGVIYPSERDPRPFFRALSRLKKDGRVNSGELQINLRASGSEALYTEILRDLDIADLVHLLPAIPYPQALAEAAASDALLLFQAANCDHQIPAKAYEYLRLGKPILALTSQTGDTAALLKETGGATIVDLPDEQQIYGAIPELLRALRDGGHSIADPSVVRRYARRNQASALAQSLSAISQSEGTTWHREPESVAGSKSI